MIDVNFRIYNWARKFVTKYEINKSVPNKKNIFLGDIELLNTVKSLSFYFPAIDTLIDIGAHKGLFTNSFNNLIKVNKNYCIEPNKEFKQIILDNNKDWDVEVCEIGISEVSGDSDYYLHGDSTMNSIVEANKEVLVEKFPYDDPNKLKTEKIKTLTLDDFMSQNKIVKTNSVFLKIDTQGNELNILRGIKNSFPQIKGIIVEHMFVNAYKNNYSFEDLVDFMKHNDFRCVGALSISRRPKGEISSVDFLFIKNNL